MRLSRVEISKSQPRPKYFEKERKKDTYQGFDTEFLHSFIKEGKGVAAYNMK
jgi:hypothetical protein